MKRKFLNFSLLASIGFLVFSTVGCSSNGEYSAPEVRLSASSLEMEVGETKKISVSVDKDYANAPVRWFTSNENVAFFRDESSGYVTAVGEGEAKVTASIAGGYASCMVTVTSGEVDPDAMRFTMSSTLSVEKGSTAKITYSFNPKDAIVAFSSQDPTVADVDSSGTVTGVAEGEVVVTGVLTKDDKQLTRTCTVTVTDPGVTPPTDLDIGVPTDLKASGSLIVGSPEKSKATMTKLLDDFNAKTGSNVKFTIRDFEDGSGVSNFPTGAASGPDLYPFVSDQTMSLNNLGALTALEKSTKNGYKSTMLDGSIDASTWNDNVLGYPFAADNGVVMFYDSSKTKAEDIDTVDKLFAKASSLNLKVGFALTNGFYAASTLHTFAGGKSMFKISSTSTSYTSSSTFDCEAGLKGLKLGYEMMTKSSWSVKAAAAPGTNQLLATIIDTSNVREFRSIMGSNYAVAPVPYVDDAHSARLCTYLGYKFYGVNGSISSSKKTLAHNVAKFLVSEYAQNYRYAQEKTQPTLKSLQSVCASEPHIAALNAQKASGSTLLLSIFGDEYFNNTAKTFTTLLNDYIADDVKPTDANLKKLLKDLDNSWQ